MRRSLPTLAAAFVLAVLASARGAAAEPETTREEVLNRYYEAIGGLDAWESVSTLELAGKMSFPRRPFGVPFTLMLKAPDKSRLEFVVDGMTAVQAVSGGRAWQIMPFHGKPDAEPMPDDQARLMLELADFDGPLVGWEEDGHALEYLGLAELDDAPVHELEVTLAGGGVWRYFLDADDFLPVKSSRRTTIAGEELAIETLYGDYKRVGSLVLAHSIESRLAGARLGQVMRIESAELDVEMADDRFSMPGASE